MCLSYAARQKMPVLLTIICISALAYIFTVSVSVGLDRTAVIRPALKPASPIEAGPGLILSRLDNNIILLRESRDVRGPRVVSIPGQPLIYQDVPRGPNNTILSLPPLPFGIDTPWFIRSLEIDLSISAAEMRNRLEDSFFSFAIYVFSLILLLVSMRFLLGLSQWPLANIFLGALVFRGILALEIFLNSQEIKALAASFLAGRLPSMLISPLAFSALAILVILYSLLDHAARSAGTRRKRSD